MLSSLTLLGLFLLVDSSYHGRSDFLFIPGPFWLDARHRGFYMLECWLFFLSRGIPLNGASQVALDITDTVSVPVSGRSPGGGHGNPLQCSYLDNPIDRGAWRASVLGVEKSQTWLVWLSMHVHIAAFSVELIFLRTYLCILMFYKLWIFSTLFVWDSHCSQAFVGSYHCFL